MDPTETSPPLGVLIDPASETVSIERTAPAIAARFGRPIAFAHAAVDGELAGAVAAIKKQDAAGLVVPGDAFFANWHRQIAALAAQNALPAVYSNSDLASSGGLMSYGADPTNGLRQVGVYVGKILKGAKPSDLPVVQPTKITLKINLKTANSLGLTIPPPLLVRADEVIE